MARARRRWIQEQDMFDAARLVFIDETSTNTAMVRLRGRCPRGIRLIDHVPHGHWKTITFIAGLRRRAMVAPFVLDGPMNAISFMAYLQRCLVPTLKRDLQGRRRPLHARPGRHLTASPGGTRDRAWRPLMGHNHYTISSGILTPLYEDGRHAFRCGSMAGRYIALCVFVLLLHHLNEFLSLRDPNHLRRSSRILLRGLTIANGVKVSKTKSHVQYSTSRCL